jgi:hypothetical protein
VRPLMLAYGSGSTLEELRYCSGGYPLYIPYLSLVQPLYTHLDFGCYTVSPPSPSMGSTALRCSLFKLLSETQFGVQNVRYARRRPLPCRIALKARRRRLMVSASENE